MCNGSLISSWHRPSSSWHQSLHPVYFLIKHLSSSNILKSLKPVSAICKACLSSWSIKDPSLTTPPSWRTHILENVHRSLSPCEWTDTPLFGSLPAPHQVGQVTWWWKKDCRLLLGYVHLTRLQPTDKEDIFIQSQNLTVRGLCVVPTNQIQQFR